MGREYKSVCALCGAEVIKHIHNAKFCDACRRIMNRQYNGKYRKTEHGKKVRHEQYMRNKAAGKQAEWERASRERRKEQRAAYDAQYAKEHKEEKRKSCLAYYHRNRDKIMVKKREYYEAHHEEILAKEKLRREAKKNKPGARLAYAKATGKRTYCERMRVTMYPLPCGQREECKGCKHCPEGAACGMDGHFAWGGESMNGGRSFR